MSAWPTKSLDEIFDIARGGSPRPIDKFITDDPDGVNWIMIGDASAGSKYIRKTKKRIIPAGVSRSRTVKPGDFLLTNSMSFGRPYIVETHGCIHDGWLVLSPKDDDVNSDYFYHLLGSPAIYGEFERLAAGATVKNLNIDLVKSIKVALPPLDEQERIAAILDQADELRRKRQRAIDRHNQLGQAIFHEMFGNFDGGSVAVAQLEAVTSKIGSGATPKGGDSAYKNEGTPLIRSMNVRDGEFSEKGLAFLDDQQASKLNNVIVQANDVLLNITGASVARVCLAPPHMDGARVNQHVSIIRLNNSITSEFLEAFLLMPRTKRKLLTIAEAGATRQAITKAQIEELEVPVPALALQQDFIERLKLARKSLVAMTNQLMGFEALFSSIQDRAFRGEL